MGTVCSPEKGRSRNIPSTCEVRHQARWVVKICLFTAERRGGVVEIVQLPGRPGIRRWGSVNRSVHEQSISQTTLEKLSWMSI